MPNRARVVVRGRDDAAAVRVAADDERPPAQLGALQLLHGGEEGVQVEMRDDHGRRGYPGGRRDAYGSCVDRVKEAVDGQAVGDLAARHAQRGALAKLASSDFAKDAISSAQQAKDRVERLVKSVSELDDRLNALEKRVECARAEEGHAGEEDDDRRREEDDDGGRVRRRRRPRPRRDRQVLAASTPRPRCASGCKP